ncbi:MAG: diadenylate cyclase [Pirellulaceae bacterium]
MLDQVFAGLRVADLLDIGVIAVLFYLGLKWFRRRASRSLVVGIGVLSLLYLAAGRFEMILTSMLFQLGFTAVLLSLIVVFQHDIRRGFERLSSWSLMPDKSSAGKETPELDALSESIAVLAQRRIGALLVFEGREPIERHVQGGVRVNGQISLPLLYSIFHPASPGHDGAVVLEGPRIEELGVHLPLSKNLAEIGDRGTRHAAALGLSERSDALVIVVSEERGTISIAEHGRLTQIQPAQLKPLLERRHLQHAMNPAEDVSFWRPRDISAKVVALLLAVALWSLFAYRVDTVQRTYIMPIEYRNAPAGYLIEEQGVNRAEVTLSGSERAFGLLDTQALVVSADVSNVAPGSAQFVATTGPTNLPSGLSVTSITPRQVPVTLQRLVPNEPSPLKKSG